MRKCWTFVLVVLVCLGGAGNLYAQGSRKDDIVLNRFGQPVAGATVRVCTSGATGSPCSPLASIYSDVALTQPLSNPMASDGQGNYHFYAAPGRYMVQISGAGVTSTTIPDVLLAADPTSPSFQSLSVAQNISALNLNLSGNLTVSGGVSSPTTLSAPQSGSNAPVRVGPHWYPGTASGTAANPTTAPLLTIDSTSTGGIGLGTYYCVFTYGNKNGETLPSPQQSITISSGTTNTIGVTANNDFSWLTGAYKMRVYCGTASGGPYFLQTPWNVSFSIATPGGCVRSSNVVTCTSAGGTGSMGVTVGQPVTVNVPNGSTSFNGTFVVTATNGSGTTFSYAQTAANDSSGTGAGTASYSTAIDTNWHYVTDGGGAGIVILSSIAGSGTQPPVTNTAAIDAVQVAVNAARACASSTDFNARCGTVRLTGQVYNLTTPLILANTAPSLLGEANAIDLGSNDGGANPRATILHATWDDANTGTVMVMGPSVDIRHLVLSTTGNTSALYFRAGYGNMNGFYGEGIVIDASTNTTGDAVKIVNANSGFNWKFKGISAGGGGRSVLFAANSSITHAVIEQGRFNCPNSQGAANHCILQVGGPTDTDHGVNFVSILSGVDLKVKDIDFESSSGSFLVNVANRFIAEGISTSDPRTAASGVNGAIMDVNDEFFSGGSGTSGIFFKDSVLIGSSNASAGIWFNTHWGAQLSCINSSINAGAVAVNFNNQQAWGTFYNCAGVSLSSSSTNGKIINMAFAGNHNAGLFFYGNYSSTFPVADAVNGFTGDLRQYEVGGAGNYKQWRVSSNSLQLLASDGSTVLESVDNTGNLAGVASVAVGGDLKFSSSPRPPLNAFFPGALTSTWTGLTFTPDKAITVTRFQAQLKTAPAGCTTNAVLRLTDGTTPITLTANGATLDSGAITQNYAAGATLTLSISTAAAGCTTSPADGNVAVQYRMQ